MPNRGVIDGRNVGVGVFLLMNPNPADVAANGAAYRGAMDKHTPFRIRQAGLTLIELMTALAVVAILAGIGVPSFRAVMANQRMVAAVNSYVGSFQQARMRSLARAGQTVVCPSADGRSCSGGLSWQHGWLIYDDENFDKRLGRGEPVVAVFGPLAGDDLQATSSIGRPQLVFRADGSAMGSNLTLTVCDERGPDHARSIVVNNGGRPRIDGDRHGRCAPPAAQ